MTTSGDRSAGMVTRDDYLINRTVYRFPNRENYYGPTSSLWLQAFLSKRAVGSSSAVLWELCTVFASLALCILVSLPQTVTIFPVSLIHSVCRPGGAN